MNEINSDFKTIKSNEIVDLIDFASKHDDAPDRILEIILYGVIAAQTGEACKKILNGEIDYKEAFESTITPQILSVRETVIGDLMTYVQIGLASMESSKSMQPKYNSEKKYQSKLIDMFDIAFPYFDFIGSEVRPHDEDRDRIDILARCKETGRNAIIELKVGNKSGHKQLRSYAHGFDNPILINISEDEVKSKRDGILYKTFFELGVEL